MWGEGRRISRGIYDRGIHEAMKLYYCDINHGLQLGSYMQEHLVLRTEMGPPIKATEGITLKAWAQYTNNTCWTTSRSQKELLVLVVLVLVEVLHVLLLWTNIVWVSCTHFTLENSLS